MVTGKYYGNEICSVQDGNQHLNVYWKGRHPPGHLRLAYQQGGCCGDRHGHLWLLLPLCPPPPDALAVVSAQPAKGTNKAEEVLLSKLVILGLTLDPLGLSCVRNSLSPRAPLRAPWALRRVPLPAHSCPDRLRFSSRWPLSPHRISSVTSPRPARASPGAGCLPFWPCGREDCSHIDSLTRLFHIHKTRKEV